jgi:hypothetical protein
MQSQLTIKRFGPIKAATLDLRDVNVFIGPQASGKSTIAKLYTICKSPLAFLQKTTQPSFWLADDMDENELYVSNFKKALEEYNIRSFLEADSEVSFTSALHDFSYQNGQITYRRKLQEKVQAFSDMLLDGAERASEIAALLLYFKDTLTFFRLTVAKKLHIAEEASEAAIAQSVVDETIDFVQLSQALKWLTDVEAAMSGQPARFIPAERNFIPVIKNAALSLQQEGVPIPRHILAFGVAVEKAAFEQKELDLDFLQPGVRYVFENGLDMLYINPQRAIRLTEAASGFQTVVPLLLTTVLRPDQSNDLAAIAHHSIVVEEPELNLFPKAQYDLVKILMQSALPLDTSFMDIGHAHTYTTHSPYILAAFNNMLYANKVLRELAKLGAHPHLLESMLAMDKAMASDSPAIPKWLSAQNFSAYQIADGTATAILNRDTGLIEDNYIDDASNEMTDDFETLMELMPHDTK